MPAYILPFLAGSILGLLACEFADRWGCSQRYRSPMSKKNFITIMSGIGAAWLHWWMMENQMLLPAGTSLPLKAAPSNLMPMQQMYFDVIPHTFIYMILFTFLLAATLTDFYEMIIPDTITVFGTVLALLFAVFCPLSALPVTELQWTDGFMLVVAERVFSMHVWSPNPVGTGTSSLLIIILLWWFWCFAMLDRVWYTKLPFRKANAIFWRYLYRSPRTKYYLAAALIAPIFLVWANCFALISAASEIALLSALVGMAAGMVLVWSIRLVAQWVLGVEAMGFGDVTLMGMIGAFLGWQPALLVFFMAPFFGLVYGMINAILGRGRAVPYGPFLCLAAVVVVVAWSPIWSATAEYFAFGIEIIGLALFGLLFLFAGLLHLVHKIMPR